MTNHSQERKRCDKCGAPFEHHHWQHYSPREGKTYHTGCFEQSKFPALLIQTDVAAKRDERDAWLSGKRCSNCAGEKSALQLADWCSKCYEEE